MKFIVNMTTEFKRFVGIPECLDKHHHHHRHLEAGSINPQLGSCIILIFEQEREQNLIRRLIENPGNP